MGLMRLYNYMRGCVECRVEGTRPARFLNLCAGREVPFWDLRYEDPNRLILSLRARDYRRIRPIARAAGCTLRLTGKRGSLYTFRRLRRRVALLVGAALLCFSLWAMNTRILTIDVTGYEKVPPAEILAAMREEGVGIWTPTASVDASQLRNRILLRLPELSWFTVTIRGSHASVDVRERRQPPAVSGDVRPADVVADRDGIITLLRVFRGEAQVREGQTVRRGDVLVSGLMPLRLDGRTLLTHAEADVRARVWHRAVTALPLEGHAKTPTGRKSVRFALCIGNKRLNFYRNGGNPFDRYDKISSRYEIRLTDGSRLPFALIRETCIEYETSVYSPDEAALTQALSLLAAERVRAQGAGSRVNVLDVRAWTEDRVLYARAEGESVQKIGATVLRSET